MLKKNNFQLNIFFSKSMLLSSIQEDARCNF